MKIAIKINDLTKNYKDVTAVDRLNLEIYEGELFSLLGVNGAGKTTTIKMLATLVKPTSGDADVFNYSLLIYEERIKWSKSIGIWFVEKIVGCMPDFEEDSE